MRTSLVLDADAPSTSVLLAILEALTQHNAEWYLAKWLAGIVVPVSARRRIIYRPEWEYEFADAPTIIRRGVASCGPIASMHAGAGRALALSGGRHEEAASHRVLLLKTSGRKWHAVYHSPSGVSDPTKGLAEVKK